jgi:secretion/DNA translocation related TadE-like protein
MLAVLLATATVALNHLRCVDAARAAARAAARNDPAPDVVAVARAVGPSQAQVTSTGQDGRVVVTVSAPVSLYLPGRPTVWVRSSAVAVRELAQDSGAVLMGVPSIGAAGRRRRYRRPITWRPPPGPPVDDDPDRGAGAILALGLVGVVIGLTAALLALGHVVTSRHQAAAAADLAALAAAQAAAGTSAEASRAGPCEVAAHVAAANGARLAACSLDPGGTATVSVRVRTWQGLTAQAAARAGPALVSSPPSPESRRTPARRDLNTEKLSAIGDESQDFVVASHVLEHVGEAEVLDEAAPLAWHRRRAAAPRVGDAAGVLHPRLVEAAGRGGAGDGLGHVRTRASSASPSGSGRRRSTAAPDVGEPGSTYSPRRNMCRSMVTPGRRYASWE